MRTVQAIAWKEIQVYFSNPMAYIVGLIYLAVTGFFFVLDLGNPFPEASLTDFFQGATIMMILLAPALTMRLISEEQKLGTIELLLTSPVKDWEVVHRKVFRQPGLSDFAPSDDPVLPALAVSVRQHPDPGPIYSGYLGLILYGAAALSIRYPDVHAD